MKHARSDLSASNAASVGLVAVAVGLVVTSVPGLFIEGKSATWVTTATLSDRFELLLVPDTANCTNLYEHRSI